MTSSSRPCAIGFVGLGAMSRPMALHPHRRRPRNALKTHLRQRGISRSFDDPFEPAPRVNHIGIALELDRTTGVATPLASLGQQPWQAAAAAASPDASVSEPARWIERTTGSGVG